jgi:2-deoxy-D-gluconate 3-dehydrogenase
MDKIHELYSLHGLRIIVTGASGGLGLSIAILLAECGATVFGLSRTGKIKSGYNVKIPANLVFDHMDVTSEEDIRTKFQEIAVNGELDVLINNAGINLRKVAEKLNEEDLNKIFQVNVNGVFLCCKHAFPFLKKSGHTGRIINITSMAAYLGFSEVLAYTASKSALLGLTRGLAVEWAKENVLVNSISPGWFPSELNDAVIDKEREQKILARMPLHRYGRPEELSPMVCFLASRAATYITGQDFSVDGGALIYGY